MQVAGYTLDQLPEPSLEFRQYFDSYLDLCEFKIEEKLGILFFLGAYLPGELNNVDPHSPLYKQTLNTLSIYSKYSGNYSDYGDIDDRIIAKWIYNTNLAISKIIGDESPLDENLRSLPQGDFIIGKSEPDMQFLDAYTPHSYSMNIIQNLNDDFFTRIGKHLHERGYSRTRSFEAGLAYRTMMSTMDVRGTNFLIRRIGQLLSVCFQALFNTPQMYVVMPMALEANTFFSLILNSLHGGKGPLDRIIHQYHQIIFYQDNSFNLRYEWHFNSASDQGSAKEIFLNAIAIRRFYTIDDPKIIAENSDHIYDSKLINTTTSVNDLLNSVLQILWNKYKIYGYDEFSGEKGDKWNSGWNNKGDYFQYLAVLFYESCLHALVVKDIK